VIRCQRLFRSWEAVQCPLYIQTSRSTSWTKEEGGLWGNEGPVAVGLEVGGFPEDGRGGLTVGNTKGKGPEEEIRRAAALGFGQIRFVQGEGMGRKIGVLKGRL